MQKGKGLFPVLEPLEADKFFFLQYGLIHAGGTGQVEMPDVDFGVRQWRYPSSFLPRDGAVGIHLDEWLENKRSLEYR